MIDPETFSELMALDQHGIDTYLGDGPEYPWSTRVYGGQVIAQALRAAMLTVDDAYRVHSLHAYFIRGGTSSEPIRFEVDRIRNGRSFCTRLVVARQSGGAILNLSASFQVTEDEIDLSTAALPDVVGPDRAKAQNWSTLLDRRVVSFGDEPGRATAWLKITEALGEDERMQTCAHAYLSDDIATAAAIALHPDVRRSPGHEIWDGFWSASLDHAMWFHRAGPADDWALHDFHSDGLGGARGLTRGRIITAAGVHVATVAQEVVLRRAVG